MKRAGKKNVTLREVALTASVSVTTVSNFVNGRYGFMSEKTRDRVQAAISSLNYRPHSVARGLRLSEWKSIGIIIVDESSTYLADGITTHIVAGLSNYLSRHDFNLIIQGQRPEDLADSTLVNNLRTDALCFMLSGKEKHRKTWMEVLVGLHQPVVIFQDQIAAAGPDTCTVMQDDETAGAMLINHLVKLGARNFLNVVPENYHWAGINARLHGADQYLRKHVRRFKSGLAICDSRNPRALWAALDREVAANGAPDAMICNSDEMAVAAVKFMSRLGKRVPQDVKITGYNGTGLHEMVTPSITTVLSRGYDMGTVAGEIIMSRLRDGRFATRCVKLPLRLQIGNSTKGA